MCIRDSVNALSLNNAGAYISQELGYALAWGNEYMGQLTDAGIPAAIVAKKIKFNFGISSNYLDVYKRQIMRRLNEKGTTLALNILNSDSWGDNESFSLSKTTYFRLEDKLGNDSVLFRNQYLKSPQKNNSWRVGITFAQPIGKKMHFRVAYNWDTNYERDNRDTYE